MNVTTGMPILTRMGANKKPKDRHKPRKMFGLPLVLAEALEKHAEEKFTNPTELLKQAVQEFLEKRDRLPKPK